MKTLLVTTLILFSISCFAQDNLPSYKIVEIDSISHDKVALVEFYGLNDKSTVKWATVVNGVVYPLIGGFDYFPALNSWTYITKKDRKIINAIWSKDFRVSSK